MSTSQVLFYPESETGVPCKVMARHVDRDDVGPLLEPAKLSGATA